MSAWNTRDATKVAAVLMLLLAAVSAVIMSGKTSSAEAIAPPPATKAQKAVLLSTSAGLPFAPGEAHYRLADQARAVASQQAHAVPLPAGGNFNGIRWEDAEGGLSFSDLQATLQYNAACQWARAYADGREAATARIVLEQVPTWPSFRDGDSAAAWRQLLSDALQGRIADNGAYQDCVESHGREKAYAKAHAMTVSR